MLLQAGDVWHFVKHLSSVVVALLQIFALPPVAELLALLQIFALPPVAELLALLQIFALFPVAELLALLQIFTLPPVAELLALISPRLSGSFSPRPGRTQPSFAWSLMEWRWEPLLTLSQSLLWVRWNSELSGS